MNTKNVFLGATRILIASVFFTTFLVGAEDSSSKDNSNLELWDGLFKKYDQDSNGRLNAEEQAEVDRVVESRKSNGKTPVGEIWLFWKDEELWGFYLHSEGFEVMYPNGEGVGYTHAYAWKAKLESLGMNEKSLAGRTTLLE